MEIGANSIVCMFQLVVAVVVAAVAAAPASDIEVVKYDNDNLGTGDYKF